MEKTDYAGLGLVAVAALALYMYLKNNSLVSGLLPGPSSHDTYVAATGTDPNVSTGTVGGDVNQGAALGYNVADAWQGGTGVSAGVNTFKWLTDALFPEPAETSAPGQTGPAYPGQVPWVAPGTTGPIDWSKAQLDTGSGPQVTADYIAALAGVSPAKPAGSGFQDDTNTGQTVGGMEIWNTPSGAVQLQSPDGTMIIGGNAAAGIIAAGEYEDTGLIWDASTGQAHNKAWYIANQPGLARTWGWA
jgi:hypothetical protein